MLNVTCLSNAVMQKESLQEKICMMRHFLILNTPISSLQSTFYKTFLRDHLVQQSLGDMRVPTMHLMVSQLQGHVHFNSMERGAFCPFKVMHMQGCTPPV